jgi:flagellum-specific peptidoglycan hydrolase FlgJ
MKVRVFYRIQHEIPPRSKETSPEVLEDVRKELTKLKSELELAKNEKDKIRIQRKITRLEQFNDVQEWKITSDKKDEVQKILTGKTTENYLGSDLHLLRKRGVDIASLTLVRESNPAEAADSSKMANWESFIVNFGGNESLKKKIGAGDILPLEVTKVKINGVECERRNNPRPGYYNDSKKPSYQKVYDGYKIEIVERKTSIPPEEIKAADEAAENRWKKIRVQDMIDTNDGNPIIGFPEEKHLFSEISIEKSRQEKMKTLTSLWIIEKGEFINDAKEAAKKVEEFFGIPWQVAFGQAALESWYGKSSPDNNYFGIKWGNNNHLLTREFLNWEWTTERSSFRGYKSLEDSFLWYGKFLTENRRYRDAFEYTDDPKSFLEAVKEAWYATDPHYVTKIEKIWRDNNIFA